MKNLVNYLLLFSLFATTLVNAQVKIGDNPEAIDQSSILELESNSKAFVITRLSEAAMNAITPLHGALVYNTDAGCVFYYNGSQWSNLCEDDNTTNVSLTLEDALLTLTDSDGNEVSVPLAGAVEQTFTANPIVNFRETVIITQDGNNYNFEVGEITGDNIVDSSINGIDIQDNSITQDQLAPNSVGQNELEENAVADNEIDYSQVTLNDFTNDAGYITTAEIISADAGNDITDQNGAYYDDSLLQDAITTNATAVNNHINNDQDTAIDNEVVTQFEIVGNDLVLTEAGVPYSVSLAGFNNSGSDDQTLAEVLTEGNSAGNQLIRDVNDPQIAQDAATKNYVDNAIASIPTGSDNQNLSLAGSNLNISGGTGVDLGPLLSSGADGLISNVALVGNNLQFTGTGAAFNGNVSVASLVNTDSQNLTGATLNGANLLTIDIQNGGSTSVDLSSLAGGASDGAITGVILNGTDLEFTGAGTGFNGSVPLASLQDGFEANTDNQNATQVPFAPYISIAATDTQAAIEELKDEVDAIVIGGGGNPTDELQDLQLAGTVLSLTNPATVGNQTDLDPTFVTETELAAFSVNDADFDPLNEIQDAAAVAIDDTAGNFTATDVEGALAELATSGVVDTDDQELTLTGTTLNLVDGGTPIDLDPTFVTETELAAFSVNDADFDPNNEIELPVGGTAGQVLSTDGAGTYSWVDDQTTAATIVSADAGQILTAGGDGGALLTNAVVDATFATDAELAAAITASETADNDTDDQNEIELPVGGTAGQVLSTDGAGTYSWVDDQTTAATIVSADAGQILTAGGDGGALLTNAVVDATFATDAELAAAITASETADNDTDDQNEIELPVGGTAGQVLSTDGAGTYSWVDDQTTAATIVSADAGQILTAGGDGGALLTNAVVDATFATDAELAAAITASETADNDTDDQNEIELPVGGTAGQVLSTDGAGTYSWVDDQDSGGLTGTAGSIFFADTDGTPTENNPQLRWDNSASRMSIGNISPQSKLDVDGQIQARNGFAANIGSAGQPSFGFSTEATMGMYRAGTSQLGFSTGGTEALRIDGTQTVIIQRDIELQEDLIDVNNSTGNTGQILSSLGTGNGVQWINAPTGGAVTTDGTTITGDGSITPLSVVNQGIGSAQIANQAVTNGKIPDNEIRPIKIETSGVTDGFVLTANGGVANWAAVSVSGDGNDFVTTGSFDQGTQNLTLNVTNQAPFTIDLQNLVTQNELTAAESGLVITTTQIQNLTILNEDINPGAAIDGSKISPVFTANVETTGTFISGGTTLNVPDYVFENYFNGFSKLNDSYKFKELSEIEAFIKKHKHLPGITSAYQAQKDGQWNLSQSNLQNLEKIEELFLHTIEQEKKIKALQQENTTLSKELDALKKDMALIKEMLAAKKE